MKTKAGQYIGVKYNGNQRNWYSRLYLKDETIHIGSFSSERKAVIALDIECIKRGLLSKVQLLKPKSKKK